MLSQRRHALERAAEVGPPGRPARRAAGELRRGAALLHRLEGAQHRAPAARAGARPEDQRVRRLPRRAPDRRGHRGIGLRGGRTALDPARAARGPRRDRGGARREAAAAGRARRSAGRSARAHQLDRRPPHRARNGAAAAARGLAYLAITDHSRRLTVARGLDPERLAQADATRSPAPRQGSRLHAADGHRGRHPRRRHARSARRGAGGARRRDRRRAQPVRPVARAADRAHPARARSSAASRCSRIRSGG